MVDTAKNGGHIYQWTLGFHVSAFEIARRRGHNDVLDLLCSGRIRSNGCSMRSGAAMGRRQMRCSPSTRAR